MREQQFIFHCCLFVFAFVFTCYFLGPVIFLILFNLEFFPAASLVHPHSAAVAEGLCFASLVFCVFLLYLCIWLSVVQILLGKAEMLLFWI